MPGKRGRRSGYMEQRGPNTWMLQADLGFIEVDGKRKRKRESWTFHGSKRDAEKDLNRRLDELGRGVDRKGEAKDITVAQQIRDYLDNVAAARCSDRTLHDYRQHAARYIYSEIGSIPIKTLTLKDIQAFYSRLQSANGKRSALSARTVRYVHHIVSAALKRAVREDLIAKNPADFAELPKGKAAKSRAVVGDVEAAQRFRDAALRLWRAHLRPECLEVGCFDPVLARGLCERHYATRRRANTLPETPPSTPWGLLLLFDLAMGLRPGELQALQWRDLDWKTGQLQIVRAVEWIEASKALGVEASWKFKDAKTEKSRRCVVVPPSLLALLREHRKWQIEERMRLAPFYHDLNLIFAGPDGKPFDRRNINRHHLPKVMKVAGLPEGLSMYGLRHSMATVMLAANENPKIVSERLGHASVTLTMNTYSHVTPSMQRAAAERLETLIFGHADASDKEEAHGRKTE